MFSLAFRTFEFLVYALLCGIPHNEGIHVMGETDRMETTRLLADSGERLTTGEAELLAAYRRLPVRYQRRLREQAEEYGTLTRTQRRAGKTPR